MSDSADTCMYMHTVKPVKNSHFQKRHKISFKTNYRLMQVTSFTECNTFDLHLATSCKDLCFAYLHMFYCICHFSLSLFMDVLTNGLTRFLICTGWSAFLLSACTKFKFSHMRLRHFLVIFTWYKNKISFGVKLITITVLQQIPNGKMICFPGDSFQMPCFPAINGKVNMHMQM